MHNTNIIHLLHEKSYSGMGLELTVTLVAQLLVGILDFHPLTSSPHPKIVLALLGRPSTPHALPLAKFPFPHRLKLSKIGKERNSRIRYEETVLPSPWLVSSLVPVSLSAPSPPHILESI